LKRFEWCGSLAANSSISSPNIEDFLVFILYFSDKMSRLIISDDWKSQIDKFVTISIEMLPLARRQLSFPLAGISSMA
jgi:hypothetical protein